MNIRGLQICGQKYFPYNYNTEQVTIYPLNMQSDPHFRGADAILHASTTY